jgi:hypothetical protein
MMTFFRILALALCLLIALPASGQYRPKSIKISPEGDSSISISIGSYYPLKDTLDWLNREYGWFISYEDPIYSENEVVDISILSWRKSHPGERGFYVPRWSEVQFRIQKPSGKSDDEKIVLNQLVDQYNRINRPERFAVLQNGKGRRTVVGSVSDIRAIPDGTVPANLKSLSGTEELQRILTICSLQSPMKLEVGTIPLNAVSHATIPPTKSPQTCRNAIQRVVELADRSLVYQIMEDIADRQLILSIFPNKPQISAAQESQTKNSSEMKRQ